MSLISGGSARKAAIARKSNLGNVPAFIEITDFRSPAEF